MSLTAIVLASLAFAFVLATLSKGLEIQSLPEPALQALANVVGQQYDTKIGSTLVRLEKWHRLALEARDVVLSARDDGREVGRLGSARLGVSVTELVTGDIHVNSIIIENAHFDGGVRVGQTPGGVVKGVSSADGLMQPDLIVKRVFDTSVRAHDLLARRQTNSIILNNVVLSLPEGLLGGDFSVKHLELTYNDQEGVLLDGNFDIGGRIGHLSGKIAKTGGDSVNQVELRLANVQLSTNWPRLKSQNPDLKQGCYIHALLEFTANRNASDQPLTANTRFGIDELQCQVGDRGDFKGGGLLQLEAKEDDSTITLHPSTFDVNDSTFVLAGRLRPHQYTTRKGGEHPAYQFEITTPSSVMLPTGSPEPSAQFSGGVSGFYLPFERRVLTDNFAIETDSGSIGGQASVTFTDGQSPAIYLITVVPEVSVSHFKQFWPYFGGGQVRNWVYDNIFDGKVKNAELEVTIPFGQLGSDEPLDIDHLRGHADLEGTSVKLVGELPPIVDASGRIEFDARNSTTTISSAHVVLPGNRKISAKNGSISIENAHQPPVSARVRTEVQGSARSLAAFTSLSPINADDATGLKADQFSGQASADVSLSIPIRNLPDQQAEVRYSVKTKFNSLALSKPIEGQKITNASGTLNIDNDKVSINAKASLNAIPATVTFSQPLGSAARQSLEVKTRLNAAARDKLAPGLNDYVKGPVDVTYTLLPDGKAKVVANLTPASINLDFVSWKKGAGVGARAEFVYAESDRLTRLTNLKVSGKSFGVSGDVTIDAKGIVSASLPSVRLNRLDNYNARLTRKSGVYAVTVRGKTFDARGLIADSSGASSGPEKVKGYTPVRVDARLNQVVGFNDVSLYNAQINYAGQGSRLDSLQVQANARDGGAVNVSDRLRGGTRRLSVKAADAGAVVRFMDYYDRIFGGRLTINLTANGKGPLNGDVVANNFTIVNEPSLARLVSTKSRSSNRTLEQTANRKIDTSRVKFSLGSASISVGDDYLKVDKGIVRSTQIGSSFKGTVYDRNNNMDLTGTFLPAYGLNRLPGEIPIVGAILGNGRERGLFGVTYRMRGNYKDPNLEVNPLSVIAPGVFRNIFEFR